MLERCMRRRQTVAGWLRIAWRAQAGLLLLAWPLAAQVKFGEFTTHLSGSISPGYTADWGNQTASDHAWTFGGAGTFSGNFYSPNFLSFTSSFYLNQSRANSDFQSISNASGLNLSSNIFGGSSFPGSVNYSLAYNSEGNYAIPGIANYVTHGNSNTFGINWSENVPDEPSFTAGFQMGNSQYSVYGANDEGNTAFDSVTLHSGYRLDGFSMGAFYSDGGSHSLIPQVISSEPASETHASTDAYGYNVTHSLPLQGSASLGITHSDWSSSYLGTTSSGGITLYTADAAVHPSEKLSLTANANYSDNLSGQLLEQVVAAGGVVAGLNANQTSSSLDLMGVATYTPVAHLQTSATVERRSQTYLGETYGVTSYGGGANYIHQLLGGTFDGSVNIIDNLSDQVNESALGFAATGTYSTMVKGWHVNGSFGYAQNVETLLVTYMNSYYNYTFTARHRWGQFNLSAGAGASQTGLTQQPGTQNSSESYNASIGYGRWITANGSYSQANGQALATGAGLVPVPIPSPTLPSSLISLYGGKSYSAAVSSSPAKRLTIAAAYAKSTSNISVAGSAVENQNEQFNTLLQYQTRQLYFNTGYARLEQGFSSSGLEPQTISSFYVGVSRWFNFF